MQIRFILLLLVPVDLFGFFFKDTYELESRRWDQSMFKYPEAHYSSLGFSWVLIKHFTGCYWQRSKKVDPDSFYQFSTKDIVYCIRKITRHASQRGWGGRITIHCQEANESIGKDSEMTRCWNYQVENSK